MGDAAKVGVVLAALLLSLVFGLNDSFAQKSPASTVTTSPQSAARRPDESWVPEDVDHIVPPVAAGVACQLSEVLERAGQRIEELVENVDRFTATEVLEHQDVDRSGRLRRAVTTRFDYLVSISRDRSGFMRVDELRNRSHSLEQLPSYIATTGTPSLVLIFHPLYIKDFSTRCEGLGKWNGQPAWQVRFEQRPDHVGHISSFVVNGATYNVNLRGRAWILADSYQVARLETDLEGGIPKIRLRLNHQDIEYRPVTLPHSNLQLWLPSSTELFVDFQGHRFYRKHSFTDFKIFSVDTQFQVSDPKEVQAEQ